MATSEYVTSTLESIKHFWNDLDIKKWSEQIGGSSAEAIEASFYFGLAFAIGFLFKKYFRFLIVCILFSLVMVKAMEYGKFITIDWQTIKTFFGVTGQTDPNGIINHYFDWIKDHLLLFVAATVGFLVGYKLG